MQETGLNGLTPQELVVLALLVEGKLYKEIAAALHISMRTVDSHTRSIYRKLGVNNRTQAAVLYIRTKLTN